VTTDHPEGNGLSEVDKAASAACTRSGAFALVLTVTLTLLITNWIQRKDELAFSTYVSYRLDLANRIENLDQNPLWKLYATQPNFNPDSMTLRQLLAAKYEVPQPQLPQPKALPKAEKQPSAKRGAPSAPTLLGATTGPPPTVKQPKMKAEPPSSPTVLSVSVTYPLSDVMQPVTDLLNKLNDSELLTHSRRLSNFNNFSVARWAVRHNNLMYRNMVQTMCFKGVQWELGTKTSDDFIPMVDKDALMDCLTFRDVKELASYELPAFSNQLIEGRIQKDVDVSPTSLMPRDLYVASYLIQLLLFFVIIHFVAYAREAVSSEAFPVKGTLFSAFAGSRGTLFVFLLALWCPLVASIAIAIISRKLWLAACTLLIGITVWSAHQVLHRKAFFKSLNPRLLFSKTP